MTWIDKRVPDYRAGDFWTWPPQVPVDPGSLNPWTCPRCGRFDYHTDCGTTTTNTITLETKVEKVVLTADEFDVLRERAEEDEELREVLEKLKDVIEVEVSF